MKSQAPGIRKRTNGKSVKRKSQVAKSKRNSSPSRSRDLRSRTGPYVLRRLRRKAQAATSAPADSHGRSARPADGDRLSGTHRQYPGRQYGAAGGPGRGVPGEGLLPGRAAREEGPVALPHPAEHLPGHPAAGRSGRFCCSRPSWSMPKSNWIATPTCCSRRPPLKRTWTTGGINGIRPRPTC